MNHPLLTALKQVLHNRDVPFDVQPAHQVTMADLAKALGDPECVVVGHRFATTSGTGFVLGEIGEVANLDQYDVSKVLAFLKGE